VEQVPERLCDSLFVPSLQTAVVFAGTRIAGQISAGTDTDIEIDWFVEPPGLPADSV
jgi:hypothetical protein